MATRNREINVVNPSATFVAEVDGRTIVVGPLPGRMMFHSFDTPSRNGAIDWEMIQRRVQTRWTSMEVNKRNTYYGAKGKYATTPYPDPSYKPKEPK